MLRASRVRPRCGTTAHDRRLRLFGGTILAGAGVRGRSCAADGPTIGCASLDNSILRLRFFPPARTCRSGCGMGKMPLALSRRCLFGDPCMRRGGSTSRLFICGGNILRGAVD